VRPLRVGVQLPEVERVVRWPEYVAMARAAEEVGFDSIWVGDHMLYRGDGRPERGPWDAWTVLAGLAAVTERVTIGPLVACTAFHHPGPLARTAAAVDELSGGRLVLALGSGWNEPEFRAFGIPCDHRVERFAEALQIVRRLFDGERVTFAYKDYAHGGERRTMTLSAMEFLRRFVHHILPRGFVRIRQSGFLANTCRLARVALARTLLATPSTAGASRDATPLAIDETVTRATWACPRCGAAMIVGPILSALHLATLTLGFDSS
jgi:hypothetical protein